MIAFLVVGADTAGEKESGELEGRDDVVHTSRADKGVQAATYRRCYEGHAAHGRRIEGKGIRYQMTGHELGDEGGTSRHHESENEAVYERGEQQVYPGDCSRGNRNSHEDRREAS